MYNDFEQYYELRRRVFFYNVRAGVFREIDKRQWNILIGKKSGKLNDDTYKILWGIVDYYEGDEGLECINELSVTEPEHSDDVVAWIANSDTYEEIDNALFLYAWKEKGIITRSERRKFFKFIYF